MKRLLVLFACVLVLTPALSAEDVRDGHWWLSLKSRDAQSVIRSAFTMGFIDGLSMGQYISAMALKDQPPALRREASDLFLRRLNEYAGRVRNDQLTAGLDAFYADWKNQKIYVPDAAWVVFNQLAGTDAQMIEKLIEAARRTSVQP